MAAFCKCGFYDLKDVHKLVAMKDDMVKTGAAELEEIQEELKATHKWLDKKHDFSGQPKDSAYQAWGEMASMELRALPELRAEALAAYKKEQAELARLHWMKASSVAELTASVAAVTPAELQKPIPLEQRVDDKRGGVLSRLSQEPGPDNAGQRDVFHALLSVLFKNTASYKKRTKNMNELIHDFELHLLQQHYVRLDEEDSCWTRGKSLHLWIWGILKKVYKMKTSERNTLHLRFVGDYKKYSLNPSGRKDPVHHDVDVDLEDLEDGDRVAAPQ